jgi:nitrite reductase (NADH) small subunit
MTNAEWIRIANCDSIPRREGRAVMVAGREIAIFNLGDRFLAIDNECPHKGGPLADGIVAGRAVVCPLHAWKVDLATGCVERPSGPASCVRTYPVRVQDGIVLLRLDAEETGNEDRAA